MQDIITKISDNLTLNEVGLNPNAYPEEVAAAGFDVVKEIEAQLKIYKQNIGASLMNRMNNDNATKLLFVDVKGNQKTLTLKKGSMKLNSSIKNYEEYIKKSGYMPEMLGEYLFEPFSWGKIKEIRKQGGELQVLCDEIYQEGNPSIEIK